MKAGRFAIHAAMILGPALWIGTLWYTSTHPAPARAQEEYRPGRGYLGKVPGAFKTIEIWEPEIGVRCYTYGEGGIDCMGR